MVHTCTVHLLDSVDIAPHSQGHEVGPVALVSRRFHRCTPYTVCPSDCLTLHPCVISVHHCHHTLTLLMMCCLLVLDSVTSTHQWILKPSQCVYLKEGMYQTRLFGGPSTNDMKK